MAVADFFFFRSLWLMAHVDPSAMPRLWTCQKARRLALSQAGRRPLRCAVLACPFLSPPLAQSGSTVDTACSCAPVCPHHRLCGSRFVSFRQLEDTLFRHTHTHTHPPPCPTSPPRQSTPSECLQSTPSPRPTRATRAPLWAWLRQHTFCFRS